jgi:translation elongation factor P/translation initiation factor 5A
MAKLRVKNIKKVISTFRKEVIKVARSKETRMEVGEIIVEDIQDNPAATAGPVTRDFREFFEQFNTTDPKYNRSLINITFTGELMKDLRNNVKVDTTSGQIEYIIEQSNKKHKNLKGEPDRKTKVEYSDLKTGKLRSKTLRQRGAFNAKQVEFSDLKTGKIRKKTLTKTHKQIGQYVEAKGYKYLNFSQRVIDKLGKFLQNKLYEELKKKIGK